jgi:hypothetical protein
MARHGIMLSMRVRALLAVAALAATTGLAGCGTELAAGARHPPSADPMSLVGRWYVRGAGEAPGTVLVVGSAMTLNRRCGNVDTTWQASASGLFVGYVDGWAMSCGTKRMPTVGWLDRAVGYRIDGVDRLLVDADGATTARLVPAPGATPSLSPYERKQLRARASAPAPVPGGLEPATTGDLLRRWVPVRGGNGKAYVTFGADGRFRGSDGCNGQAGKYLVGEDGELIAVSGPQTLIGCDNVEIDGWLGSAGRAALDGSTLVLLDAHAHEIARLKPATT